MEEGCETCQWRDHHIQPTNCLTFSRAKSYIPYIHQKSNHFLSLTTMSICEYAAGDEDDSCKIVSMCACVSFRRADAVKCKSLVIKQKWELINVAWNVNVSWEHFKRWLTCCFLSHDQSLLDGYPPNHVLSALHYLASKDQKDLEEKISSLDVKRDVTALR